ncbi:MAG: hypothetical protein ACXWF8_05395 [Methylobacter sp.]
MNLLNQQSLGAKKSIDEYRLRLQTGTTVIVKPLEIWIEDKISTNGKPYENICVDYTVDGFSTLMHYFTATFTQSGRLIAEKLNAGKTYKVTVKTNERHFDEWVGVEEVMQDNVVNRS